MDRRLTALAFVLAALVSFAGIGSHTLWTPDEPRDASVGLDMLRAGDYAIPRLNGEPFLEKPPLFWWSEAASYALLSPGATAPSATAARAADLLAPDTAARVPSALFGALALVVTFALGMRLAGPQGGLLGLMACASTVEFSEATHRAIVDPPLVAFVALAHLGAVLLISPRGAADRRLGTWLLALALPLTFLSKGVVGPALALAPPLMYLGLRAASLWDDRGAATWLLVGSLWPAAAIALPALVVIVGPWALALYHEGGWTALRETLVVNTVGRFVSDDANNFGHHRPLWYYFVYGPPALAPWVAAIPAMLRAGLLRARSERERPREVLFATFVFGVLFLSVPSGKRELYLTPLIPALGATVGWWLATVADRKDAGAARLDRLTLLALLAVVTAAPLLLFGAAIAVRVHPPAVPGLDAIRPAVTTGLLAGLAAISVAWVGGLGAALRRHLAAGTTPSAFLVAGPILALTVLIQTGVKAVIDPVKDLHPLTAAIAAEVPPTEDIVVYAPDETIRGIVPFDLDRRVFPAYDVETLERALDAGARHVVYEEKWEEQLPVSIRERLRRVRSGLGPASRPYAIAAVRR